jgi:hypothetical protein
VNVPPAAEQTAEDLESALIVAALAHATERNPKKRAAAWQRLLELKARHDRVRGRR